MRILHTADWHLGKKLEGYSRLKEQKKFIDELIEIADEKKVDIAIIAGDIYDTSNPQAEAEKLYYESIKRLSNKGSRPVIVVAGNHDNPKRIVASEPLAKENGIISFGYPNEVKETGRYGNFLIKESYEGGILLSLDSSDVFINALPYPTEKSLSKIFSSVEELSYSDKVAKILNRTHSNVKKGIKSIIVSHLFTLGSEIGDGERELGGSQIFDLSTAPKSDYIALGHIHKMMKFDKYNAAYSGSIMEYRSSEARYRKKVLIKDLESGTLEEIEVKNQKPIVEYTAFGVEDAIKKSIDLMDKDEWIYLTIESDVPIKNNDLKKIKENKNIILVIPKINWQESNEIEIEEYTEENIIEAFKVYYKNSENKDIDQKTLDMFIELIGEDA